MNLALDNKLVSTTSEDVVDTFMEYSCDAVFLIDSNNFQVVNANQSAAFLMGNFREALLEFTFDELVAEDYLEDWKEHIEATKNGEQDSFTGILQTSLGDLATVEIRSKLIQHKNTFKIISFIKEVSGFDHQIKELKKQLEFYETILNEMPIQFAVLSPKWRYMFINKKSIGDDNVRNWLVGKTDHDYFIHRNKDTTIADNRVNQYKEVVNSKVGKEWIDKHTGVDGDEQFILRKLFPYFVDDKLLLTFGFGLDITDRVENEQERVQMLDDITRQNEELKQFAYIIAHDLKEPLRNISSFSRLLEMRYKKVFDGEALEFLNFITNNVTRMNNLMSDLLGYITLDNSASEMSLFNSNMLVEIVEANMQVRIQETNTSIIKENLPEIHCNKIYLTQLFQNIIGNAIKFCKHSPIITIRCTETDTHHQFEIEDNGIGISLEYQEKIFRIFNRLNKRQYEGTGMGLAICKKIIQLHDGNIWVKSDGETGTSFFFTVKKQST